MKFSDEYKLTEYYQVQSTIDYITKGTAILPAKQVKGHLLSFKCPFLDINQ